MIFVFSFPDLFLFFSCKKKSEELSVRCYETIKVNAKHLWGKERTSSTRHWTGRNSQLHFNEIEFVAGAGFRLDFHIAQNFQTLMSSLIDDGQPTRRASWNERRHFAYQNVHLRNRHKTFTSEKKKSAFRNEFLWSSKSMITYDEQ